MLRCVYHRLLLLVCMVVALFFASPPPLYARPQNALFSYLDITSYVQAEELYFQNTSVFLRFNAKTGQVLSLAMPEMDFNLMGGELSDYVDVKVNGRYLVAEQGATFLRYSIQTDEKSRSVVLKMSYGIGKKEPFRYELACEYRLYAGETRLERSATLTRPTPDQPITLPRLPPEVATTPERVIDLDLEKVDLYTALNLLFEQARVLHTVHTSFKGSDVTVRLHKSFQKALEALLIASGLPLTYQVEDGVYSVIPITERDAVKVRVNVNNSNAYEALKQIFEQAGVPYRLDTRLQLATLTAQFEMPLKQAVEAVIRMAHLPYAYHVDSGVHELVPEEMPPTILLDLENVDVYEAVETALKKAKALYVIDNALRGVTPVTVHLRMPPQNAIEAVLRASGRPFGYRIENGVYYVGYAFDKLEGFRFGYPRFIWHGCQVEAPGPWTAESDTSPAHTLTPLGDRIYQFPSAPDTGLGLIALTRTDIEHSLLFWMDTNGGETRYQPSLRALGVTPFLDLAFDDYHASLISDGVSVKSDTLRMEANRGSLQDALPRYRQWATRSFPNVVATPNSVKESVLLEVSLDKFKGGFKEITQYLPFYRQVGFNTLILTPHWKGGYKPLNPSEIEPKYGTQADLKALVSAAHAQGLRVLFGMTIHGFDEKSPAIDLGQMFATDENYALKRQDGTALVNRASPQYQDYIRLLAQNDQQTYGMDGYRIERANYQSPTWQSGWNQPAYAAGNQSPLVMQIALNALREKSPQASVLSGEPGMVFHTSANLVQDNTANGIVHFQELLRTNRATAKDYKLHLANTRDMLPSDSYRVYASRSHATEAIAKFAGDTPQFRALEAIHALCGVPQVYAEAPQESPRLFEFYRRLFALRKRFPELTRGELYLREVDTDNPQVFAAMRSQGGATTWILISLSDKPLIATVATSLSTPLPTRFLDPITNKRVSAGSDGQSLKITLQPGQILIGNREVERESAKPTTKAHLPLR